MSERASSAKRGGERLSGRRRKRRRRAFIALCVLVLLFLGALVYGLWQPGVRISHIEVYGVDASAASVANEAMQGSYFGIIPRNSAFFPPTALIRADILAAYPGIAAVSIFRNGFTGLSIKADPRTPLARWCGPVSASSSPEDSPVKEVLSTASGDCYLFDPSGFVYATATEAFSFSATASSSPLGAGLNPDQTLVPYVLFDPLASGAVSPVGATLKDASQLSRVFDFAQHIGLLGPSVGTIVIRGPEVDFFLATSTYGAPAGLRITYLLGDEQNALTALVSAKGQLDLSDPTLEYVDLRFSGKIYLKKRS